VLIVCLLLEDKTETQGLAVQGRRQQGEGRLERRTIGYWSLRTSQSEPWWAQRWALAWPGHWKKLLSLLCHPLSLLKCPIRIDRPKYGRQYTFHLQLFFRPTLLQRHKHP